MCCETADFVADATMNVSVRGTSKEQNSIQEASARSISKERIGSRGWSTWLSTFSQQTSHGSTSSKDPPACENSKNSVLSKDLRKSPKNSTCSKNTKDLEQPPHSVERTARDEEKKPASTALVTLHVYNTCWIGGGAASRISLVHLGVEVYRHEFSFGRFGVRTFKPGRYDESKHYCSLQLGVTSLQPEEVYDLLLSLRDEYPPDRYRLVGCNCQTFAAIFSERLGLGSGCIPEEYLLFAKPLRFASVLDSFDLFQSTLYNDCLGSGSSGLSSTVTEVVPRLATA